jgi:hypothetical protein
MYPISLLPHQRAYSTTQSNYPCFLYYNFVSSNRHPLPHAMKLKKLHAILLSLTIRSAKASLPYSIPSLGKYIMMNAVQSADIDAKIVVKLSIEILAQQFRPGT